jgi:hypothetical protein
VRYQFHAILLSVHSSFASKDSGADYVCFQLDASIGQSFIFTNVSRQLVYTSAEKQIPLTLGIAYSPFVVSCQIKKRNAG